MSYEMNIRRHVHNAVCRVHYAQCSVHNAVCTADSAVCRVLTDHLSYIWFMSKIIDAYLILDAHYRSSLGDAEYILRY